MTFFRPLLRVLRSPARKTATQGTTDAAAATAAVLVENYKLYNMLIYKNITSSNINENLTCTCKGSSRV